MHYILLQVVRMRESAISMTLLLAASIAFYIYASDYIDMVDAYNKVAIAQNNAVLIHRDIDPEVMLPANGSAFPAGSTDENIPF